MYISMPKRPMGRMGKACPICAKFGNLFCNKTTCRWKHDFLENTNDGGICHGCGKIFFPRNQTVERCATCHHHCIICQGFCRINPRITIEKAHDMRHEKALR